MELFCNFQQSTNRHLNVLSDGQVKLLYDLQEMKMSLRKLEKEVKLKDSQNQYLLNKGMDTIVSGLCVLESHQVHISKQIADLQEM